MVGFYQHCRQSSIVLRQCIPNCSSGSICLSYLFVEPGVKCLAEGSSVQHLSCQKKIHRHVWMEVKQKDVQCLWEKRMRDTAIQILRERKLSKLKCLWTKSLQLYLIPPSKQGWRFSSPQLKHRQNSQHDSKVVLDTQTRVIMVRTQFNNDLTQMYLVLKIRFTNDEKKNEGSAWYHFSAKRLEEIGSVDQQTWMLLFLYLSKPRRKTSPWERLLTIPTTIVGRYMRTTTPAVNSVTTIALSRTQTVRRCSGYLRLTTRSTVKATAQQINREISLANAHTASGLANACKCINTILRVFCNLPNMANTHKPASRNHVALAPKQLNKATNKSKPSCLFS